MDIILTLLIGGFGIFSTSSYVKYVKAEEIVELPVLNPNVGAAGVIVHQYLYIIDNINDFDKSIEMKKDVVGKMRRYVEEIRDLEGTPNIKIFPSSHQKFGLRHRKP